MAYVGYTRAPVAARPALSVRLSPPLAWGRLLTVTVSMVAWAGIIAAARVVF